MISEQYTSNNCPFCTRMSMEKKILFVNLLRILSKELQRLRKQSQNNAVQGEGGSFKQVLRIIFDEQATEHQNLCEHRKYLTYFTNKLNCNEHVLNYLCQKLAQRLAEKHYHLELLSMQVKNSAESIIDRKVWIEDEESSGSQVFKKVQSQKNKEKHEVRKKRKRVQSEVNEGTVHTGSTLAGNSMSFIPVFNSQLNIAEPPQTSISMPNANNIGFYYPYQFFYSHQSQ